MPELEFLSDSWRAGDAACVRAREADEPSITRVFVELRELIELLGPDSDPGHLAREMVRHENLPPNGVAQRERTFRIDRGDDSCAGVFSLYLGHPTPETVYVGSLFLRPTAQRLGLGTAVMDEIETRAAAAGWREIRLAVGLRNWPALRFWTSAGYDRVTKISGDPEYGSGRFALIELAKTLERPG